MNKVVGLLTLCVLFAVLKAAVVALVVAMIVALLLSFITQPRETLILLGTLALMGLANAHPLACIIALGVIGVAAVIFGNRRRIAADSLSQGEPARPLIELEPRSKA
jgi:chromate transport protein ChrA